MTSSQKQQEPGGGDLLKMARALAARYRSVPGYDYEDLVQEAYLTMLRAPVWHTHYQLKLRAWKRLGRIAQQAGVSIFATAKTLPRQVEEAEKDEAASSAVGCEDDDLARMVRQVLPAREAEVLAMLYWQELTQVEVGRRLGVTGSRVSQIHTKALERLHAHLARRGEGS